VAVVKAGQRIRAELVASKGGDFHLETIWPDDAAANAAITAGARSLAEDTHTARVTPAYREIGKRFRNLRSTTRKGA